MPSCRVSSRASRSSLLAASITARRETTTLLRFWSSLMTLNSSSLPSRCSGVAHRAHIHQGTGQERADAVDVHGKAALDLAVDDALDHFVRLVGGFQSFQASARLAFSRDSLVSPKPSSTVSSATCTSSPIFRVHSPLASVNWARGITPSDLRPACTVTHSLSISMTTPVTMAPGCISTVFRLSSKSSAKDSLITHYLFVSDGLYAPNRASSRPGFIHCKPAGRQGWTGRRRTSNLCHLTGR